MNDPQLPLRTNLNGPSACRLAWCAALLAVFAACGEDPDTADAGGAADTAGPSFNLDSGAEVAAVDAGGPACTSNADCEDPTGRCDTGTGKCVQCLIDGDCPGRQNCQDSACLPNSCKVGETVCKDPATLATCKADGKGFDFTGCGLSKVCHDGGCHEATCKPGEKKCATDGRSLLVCNVHGTALEKKPCSQTETCFAAVCKPHVCKPGKKL